jgi:hypothetical protein
MRLNTILNKLRALASKAKGRIVQNCPPELYACEACGQLDCSNEAWLNCRHRLAAARFMKTGDQQALAELKQLRMARDHELRCKLPAMNKAGAVPNSETCARTSIGKPNPS